MTTIYKSPFLLAHPEIYALLSGVSRDSRWRGDGEYFKFTVDDKHGRRVFSTRYVSLDVKTREYAEGLLRASIIARFPGSSLWFDYLRVIDGLPYVATVRVIAPARKKRGMTFIWSNAQIQLFLGKTRKLVKPQIESRFGKVVLPRSTSVRANPEEQRLTFTRIYEGFFGGYWLTPTTATRQLRFRTWTGVRTPGFSKLKSSQLPVNPHTVKIVETSQNVLAEMGYVNTTDWNMTSAEADYHYILPPDPVHLPLARNNAIRKLIDKAQLGIDANLAQDLAQYGQTTRLIGDNLHRIGGALKALRHGNVVQAADILMHGRQSLKRGVDLQHIKELFKKGSLSRSTKALANNWLMLQYGWKPILNDIHGLMQSLKALSAKENFVKVVTVKGSARSISEKSLLLWNDPTIVGGSEVTTTRTRCKFVLRYKIDDHLKTFLAQLGFTNPVNLGWEIIPFSFVFDWVLPIGPFLETLSAWDGLVFVDGSQTLFTRSVAELAVDYHGQGKQETKRRFDCTARRVQKTILLNRTKLTTFPTVTLPAFKNPLSSVAHALNGLALIAKYAR